MDTPEEFTHVSLCAGYAGIDLGLRRAIRGIRTVAFSEIEAFAIANLVSKIEAGHLDAAPVWTNLKTFPWRNFRDRVDFLSGGYPCQPFSLSGNRLGFDDPRHLWPFIAAGIAIMRPRVCFFENVEGHITLGLLEVLRELRGLGYRVTAGIFSASAIGASQQRKRIFILAHLSGTRLEGYSGHFIGTGTSAGRGAWDERDTPLGGLCNGSLWPARPGERQFSWEPPRVLADDYREREQQPCGDQPEGGRRSEHGGQDVLKGETLATMDGDVDGRAGGMDYAELCVACDNRTDELRLLGNGVMPEVAERAFRTLWDELDLI